MTRQPSWLATAAYSQVVPGRLGVPHFLWSLGLRGLQECPNREAGKWNKGEDSHNLIKDSQLSRRSKGHTYTELPFPSAKDFRIHCPLLVPAAKDVVKTFFSVVSKLPISYSSFKFKPYLCLIKTKSMQAILWGSGSEIKGSSYMVLFLKDILGRDL